MGRCGFALLEKAIAKKFGGYAKINGGVSEQVYALLTGCEQPHPCGPPLYTRQTTVESHCQRGHCCAQWARWGKSDVSKKEHRFRTSREISFLAKQNNIESIEVFEGRPFIFLDVFFHPAFPTWRTRFRLVAVGHLVFRNRVEVELWHKFFTWKRLANELQFFGEKKGPSTKHAKT